jgi:ParB family chromosome partitioning protein
MPENINAAMLPIAYLVPFEGHVFKPYDGDKLTALASSIKENGVVTPIIVQPKGDKYEMLSGHKRFQSSRAEKSSGDNPRRAVA